MERRPLVWISLFLIAGIYLAEYCPTPMPWVSGVLALWALWAMLRRIGARATAAALLCVAAGVMLWGAAQEQAADTSGYEGRMIELQGTAYGLEGIGTTFELRDCILRAGNSALKLRLPLKIRLRSEATVPMGISGCPVVIRTLYQPAVSAANPNGFDYETHLRRSGYQTELKVASWQLVSIGSAGRHDLRAVICRFRSWYGRELIRFVSREEGAVAFGMAIGDTELISDDLIVSYRTSGLGHLLSVSGLHFVILYHWLNGLLTAAQVSSRTRAAVITGVLTFLGMLNGWSAPALRAWGMILLYMAAKGRYRRYDGLAALSAAALLTAAFTPLQVLQPGFQFSYGAVLCLMTLTRSIAKLLPGTGGYLKEYAAASLAVQGVVLPLGIYWFGFWNPLTLLLNLPAAVLSEWLMPLLVLFPAAASLGSWAAAPYGFLIRMVVWAVNSCSRFMMEPAQDWLLPSPTAGAVMGLMLAALARVRTSTRSVGGEARRLAVSQGLLVLAVMVLSFHSPWAVAPGITFYAVGQGDGALIRYENKAVLVDTGPKAARLDKLLLRNGISRIDDMVLTHGHEDHIGGASDILLHLKVGRVIVGTEEPENPLYREMAETAGRKGVPLIVVKRGDKLVQNRNRALTVLYPEKNHPEQDPNAHSLVLLYNEGGIQTLFTGDLTKAGEETLLASGLLPDVDIVKVPHHGSRTSSSQPWLKRIRAEIAVISTGPNLYGLPNHDIMEAYVAGGSTLYRTDTNGAVQVTVHGGKMTLKTWR